MTEGQFYKLYNNISPTIISYMKHHGMNQEVSRDITQDTFIRLWNHKDELNSNETDISGFIWRTAKNLKTDYYRKHNKEILQGEIKDEDVGYYQPYIYTKYEDAITKNILKNLLNSLNYNIRKIFELFYFDCKSIKEIAEILNMSESNVKINMFRSKKKMKNIFENNLLYL